MGSLNLCWICVIWLFNLNSFAIDLDLRVFLNFKHFIFTDLFANPIGLLGVLQRYDMFTQVKSRLHVKIIELLGHSCVVDDEFQTFVDIVWIFLRSTSRYFQTGNLRRDSLLWPRNLSGRVWLWPDILFLDFLLIIFGDIDALVFLRLWLMLRYLLRSLTFSSKALLLLALLTRIPRGLSFLLQDLLLHNWNRGSRWQLGTNVALADAEITTSLFNVVVGKLVVTFYSCLHSESHIFDVVRMAYSDAKV